MASPAYTITSPSTTYPLEWQHHPSILKPNVLGGRPAYIQAVASEQLEQ
jgi:hypothetical protein